MTGPYDRRNPDPALLAKADRVEAALAELDAAVIDMLLTPGSLGFDRDRADSTSSAQASLRRAQGILAAYVRRVRAYPWGQS